MRQLESLGKALVVLGIVLGVVFAFGLLQWESSTRAAAALANPSPTVAIPLPSPSAAVAQATQPPATPATVATVAAAPTAPVTPVPGQTPSTPGAVASPTGAAATQVTATTPATAATQATTPTSSTGDPVAGAQTFANTCGGCHPNGNQGVGPQLYGPQFPAKYSSDATLKAFIRAGRGQMPAFTVAKLSDADLNNIVAYLRTLK